MVLTDLWMPRMDAVTATERLAAEHPAVRVLVLTTRDPYAAGSLTRPDAPR